MTSQNVHDGPCNCQPAECFPRLVDPTDTMVVARQWLDRAAHLFAADDGYDAAQTAAQIGAGYLQVAAGEQNTAWRVENLAQREADLAREEEWSNMRREHEERLIAAQEQVAAASTPIVQLPQSVEASIKQQLADTEFRLVIDADCPQCKWGERWFSPERELFGCSKCDYTSTERNA